MKRFKTFILSIVAVLSVLPAMASDSLYEPSDTDSIEISLLTCTPGRQIWSEFGHTAIRLNIVNKGIDLSVNYGMFSSDTPHFIWKFIFGLTDYWVDIEGFQDFLYEYEYSGRGVIEQKLNITHADKLAIARAIYNNIRPENKVYRYNFFYDNCTTRARDIIVDNLGSAVTYPPAQTDSCTYREMVHKWTRDYPWTRFGEDLLLGLPADLSTTKAQQQFLPDNLRADFDRTLYRGRPLVSSTEMIVMPQNIEDEGGFPLSPMDVVMILLVAVVLLELIECRRKRIYWGIDLFLMLLTGLPGVIITAMIFSEHPTVSLNLLILILNPVPLFMAYPAIRRTIQHRGFWWWTVWEILIVLFMIGGFFQTYPSGMIVMALILLTRPLVHHYINRQTARTNE